MKIDNNNESLRRALKIVSVFSKSQKIFGLPSDVVGIGAAVCAVLFLLLSKLLAIVFGAVFFYMMYQIHETDPSGYEVWKNALRRNTTGWDATVANPTKLIIVSSESYK